APLSYLASADQRVFLPYLLGAFAMAALMLLLTGQFNKRALLGLFSKRVWLHPSSLLDYKLVFAKPVVGAIFFAPWIFSSYVLAIWVFGRLDSWRGIPEQTTWSAGQIG